MIGENMASIRGRSKGALKRLANFLHLQASLHGDLSYVGSGSSPTTGMSNSTVSTRHATFCATTFARRLRRNNPPMVGFVADDHLNFNLRTVLGREIDEFVAAVERAAG